MSKAVAQWKGIGGDTDALLFSFVTMADFRRNSGGLSDVNLYVFTGRGAASLRLLLHLAWSMLRALKGPVLCSNASP